MQTRHVSWSSKVHIEAYGMSLGNKDVCAWQEEDEVEDPKAALRRLNIAPEIENEHEARVLCARCYSLSHYG